MLRIQQLPSGKRLSAAYDAKTQAAPAQKKQQRRHSLKPTVAGPGEELSKRQSLDTNVTAGDLWQLDYLAKLELFKLLEDDFRVNLPESVTSRFQTVRDVVDEIYMQQTQMASE